MKIEVLYSELCCLYGDKGNTLFLKKCLPEAEFIETTLNARPAFLDTDVALCCMYSMSEQSQERILERLMPHREEIARRIANGKTLFLLLGNALELLGQYIQREDGSRIEALGIYPTYAVRQAPNRFNTLMQTRFQDMTLIGYTSRFSHTYGLPEALAMNHMELGTGANPETRLEGIFDTNVIATYLLGPLLVANPDFSLWLLKRLGAGMETLPYEAELRAAYERKLEELQRPDLVLE